MEENRRKRKASEGDSSKSSDDSVLDQKTSTQILNELFGAFELTLDTKAPSKKSKKEKKKKKEKHKHKHKEKDKDRDRERDKEKHKKRDHRKSSSDSRRISLADDDCSGLKIEVKKDKDSKKDDFRRESREESRRDSKEDSRRDHKEGSRKDKDLENKKDKESKASVENNSKPTTKASSPEPKISEPDANDENEVMGIDDKEMSPDLPSVAAKSEENDEPTEVFEIGAPKPPTGVLIGPAKGKIQIKSLKTSAVFEQTIREVEEEARKRAEKYEEGELTPSTCSQPAESTTPSLSDMELPPSAPTPPLPLPAFHLEDSSPEKLPEEKKSRHRSGKEDDCVAKLKAKLKSRSRSREKRGKSGESKRHRSRDRHGKDQTKERKRSRSRDRSSRDQRHRERRRSPDRGIRDARDIMRTRRAGRSRSRDRDRDKRRGGRESDRPDRRERRDRRNADGRERPEDDERIDKRKLLAIARRNAMYLLKEQQERMIQAGIITGDASTVAANPDGKGGKTVAELTEYCKQLVKSGSGSSDDDSDISLSDGEGPTESFIHHPFTLKDRPNAIILNIRNSTQLPTRSMQEKAAETSKMRSLQFPVSSGQQHRSSEWVPVSPKKDEPAAAPASKAKPAEKPAQECQVIDIGSIVSQKLSAMRKMQETAAAAAVVGPDYGYGYGQHHMQQGNLSWESGQFTGSTGVRVLTPAELASGQQAWARKDQLKTAAPVAGGMGMKLLQKMGWRPGEGLGKNKEGSLEPLKLDVKFDKKGLVAQEESRTRFQPFGGTRKKGAPMATPPPGMGVMSAPILGGGEIFTGKHPVSALVELCTKRHWNPPTFDVVFESGPDHKKNFVFKVTVNNKDYQPNVACGNKKQAKAMAAQHCLEQLGLIIKMPG